MEGNLNTIGRASSALDIRDIIIIYNYISDIPTPDWQKTIASQAQFEPMSISDNHKGSSHEIKDPKSVEQNPVTCSDVSGQLAKEVLINSGKSTTESYSDDV